MFYSLQDTFLPQTHILMKGERDSLPISPLSTNTPWTTPLLPLLYSLPGNCCCPAVTAVPGISTGANLCLKVTGWCRSTDSKEYDCPAPSPVRLRQLWQCHPQHNTYLRDRADSSFAANQKASFQFNCSVQELHTVGFPAFHLLRHFSSVTWNFSKCSAGGTSTEGQVGGGL